MRTVDISSTEWRWLVIVSAVLIFFSTVPFLTVSGIATPIDLQFMGGVHRYADTATEMSHVIEGFKGQSLAHMQYTPEPHSGIFTDILQLLAGALARVSGISPQITYQVLRVVAALFMYMSIYYLGASIWTKLRSRRTFFLLATFGGGLGWILGPLLNVRGMLDLSVSPLFPYHTTLYSANLSFATGTLALLASALIGASGLAQREWPSVTNNGLSVILLSLLLGLVYPPMILPILVAFLCLIVARTVGNRSHFRRDMSWMLWCGVPVLPVLLYYGITLLYNPVAQRVWIQNHVEAPPTFEILLISLGLPLLIAVPGIVRAVRRFEADGNQFMLGWLVTVVILIYLTPVVRVNFGVGLMIAIAYFATRAVEDFWFQRIARPWRYRLYAAILPLLAASHVITTLQPLTDEDLYVPGAVALEQDYADAFDWLLRFPSTNYVTLAAPNVSMWVPAWTGSRVVYGSPFSTLNPNAKLRAVLEWYQSEELNAECETLLNGNITDEGKYHVLFVLYGPQERKLGAGRCIGDLQEVATFDSVTLYRHDFIR